MFKLEIKTTNAAFGETGADRADAIAALLRDVANRLERMGHAPGDSGQIRDTNGNSVGRFALTED